MLKRTLGFALLILGLGAVIYLVKNVPYGPTHHKMIGRKAPMDIFAQAEIEKTHDEKGPKLVYFTANWCPTCQDNKPLVLTLPAPLYVVAYRDNAPLNAEMAAKVSKFVRDRDAKKTMEWGIAGVPVLFLVDENGIIKWVKEGRLHDSDIKEGLMPILHEMQEPHAQAA